MWVSGFPLWLPPSSLSVLLGAPPAPAAAHSLATSEVSCDGLAAVFPTPQSISARAESIEDEARLGGG